MSDGACCHYCRKYKCECRFPGDDPRPMTDGDALYDAILAAPADDAPRLVYADWLTENGEEDYGAFIRVQVELARHPGMGCGKMYCSERDPGGLCDSCRRYKYLLSGERALWQGLNRRFSKEHRGFWVSYGHDPDDKLKPKLTFRRGFPAVVRLTLAALMGGGRCDRCESHGYEVGEVRWENGGPTGNPMCPNCGNSFQNVHPSGSPDLLRCASCKYVWRARLCPTCHGTGTVPGCAAALGRLPLELVELTDREPVLQGESFAGWVRDDEHATDRQPLPDLLPIELYDHLEGGYKQWDSVTWKRYLTADAAHAALSAAAIAYCRARANPTPAGASVVGGTPVQ